MQSPVRLGITLMIICMVAAGLLAFTNAKTEPIIDENEQRELEEALKEPALRFCSIPKLRV